MREIVWVPEPREGPLPLSAWLWELHCFAHLKYPWQIVLNVEPLSKQEASSKKHAGLAPQLDFPIREDDRQPASLRSTPAGQSCYWGCDYNSHCDRITELWLVTFCKVLQNKSLNVSNSGLQFSLCHKETFFPLLLTSPFLHTSILLFYSPSSIVLPSWQVESDGEKDQTFPGILCTNQVSF